MLSITELRQKLKAISPSQWLSFLASSALLYVTAIPFLIALGWELFSKALHIVVKRFKEVDWSKTGRILKSIGQDIAESRIGRMVQKVAKLPGINFLIRETGAVLREGKTICTTFVESCHNSGRVGGIAGASLFFGSIVGLSVLATLVKIPLIAYHLADAPQLIANLGTWLFNHATFSHLSAPEVGRLPLPDFLTMERWPDYGQWPLVGSVLDTFIGTEEKAIHSTIYLGLGAKLIKPAAMAIYYLFPQMKQEKPYQWSMQTLHALGHASMAALKFLTLPIRMPLAAVRYGAEQSGLKEAFRNIKTAILQRARHRWQRLFPRRQQRRIYSQPVEKLRRTIMAYIRLQNRKVGGLFKNRPGYKPYDPEAAQPTTPLPDIRLGFRKATVLCSPTAITLAATGVALEAGAPQAVAATVLVIGLRLSQAARNMLGRYLGPHQPGVTHGQAHNPSEHSPR